MDRISTLRSRVQDEIETSFKGLFEELERHQIHTNGGQDIRPGQSQTKISRSKIKTENDILKVSDSEIIKWKEAFNLFDKDGSGAVSIYELECIMRSIGMNPTKAKLQEMVEEVDLDGSGEVDFEEFLTMMTQTKTSVKQQQDFVDVVNKVFVNTISVPRNAEEEAAARQHRRLYLGLKRDNDTTFRDPNPKGGTFEEYKKWCDFKGFGETEKNISLNIQSATNLIPWNVGWKRESWWGSEQDTNAIAFQRAIHRVGNFLRKEDNVDDEEFQLLREAAAVKNLEDAILCNHGMLDVQMLNRAKWLLDKARVYIKEHRLVYEKKSHIYSGEMPKWWMKKVIQRKEKIKDERISKAKAVEVALCKMKKFRSQDSLAEKGEVEGPCFLLVDSIVRSHQRAITDNRRLYSKLDPILRPEPKPEERWTMENHDKEHYQADLGYEDHDPDHPYRSSGRPPKRMTKDDKMAMKVVSDYVTETGAWMTAKTYYERSPEERLAYAKRIVRMYMDRLNDLEITRHVTNAKNEIMDFVEKILPQPDQVETKAQKQERLKAILWDGMTQNVKVKGEDEGAVDIFVRWSGISQQKLYEQKLAAKKLPKSKQPWICLVCMKSNEVGTSRCSVCCRKPGEPATSWKLAKHRPRNSKLNIKYFHTHNIQSYRQQKEWLNAPTKEAKGVDWLQWNPASAKSKHSSGNNEGVKLPKIVGKDPVHRKPKPFLIIDEANLPQIESFKFIGRDKRNWLTGEPRSSRHYYHLLY